MEPIRLQKVLAAAGLGSRRYCEILIEQGRVAIDGEIVRELGVRVDPETQVIHVDGVRIAAASGHVVVALNKPRGVITTMSDPQGRPCVGDLVEKRSQELGVRLFHVGRLDGDTSGLLLLTNDGELAQRLGHPSYTVDKVYVARVQGAVESSVPGQILRGVQIDGIAVAATDCRIRDRGRDSTILELTIHEGRNRIVRRLFEDLGYPVLELARIAVGPVRLGNQQPGELRELSGKELGGLYKLVGL